MPHEQHHWSKNISLLVGNVSIKSADLFSAGTALLRHNSVLEFLKSSSLWSSKGKILHLLKVRSLLPSSSFSSLSKRGRNDSKCDFPASPPGWGSPEAPVTGDRWTEPECLTGSSSLLVWGETREGPLAQKGGGTSHGQKALLAVEAGPCHTQVLSRTPSPRLSGIRSCPCLPWAEHLGRDLFPPSQEQPLPWGCTAAWAPEVTNPTKAQGDRGFAATQEVLQGCSWKQRMSRALQRVLSKPKVHSGVWDHNAAGMESGLKDLGSFSPVEGTKLNKMFQGRIQSHLCQGRQEDFKMEKVFFPFPV